LPCGYIIAFSFGKGAINEAARFLNEENIIIKLIRVDEIIPIAKKPKLTVTLNDLGIDEKGLREIEFTAIAESDAGIEFFSWDFEYIDEIPPLQKGGRGDLKVAGGFRPNIMLDKEGRQTYKFKPGSHSIAVKAVDNDGLEAIEVVKVKVNGEIRIF
jgi:hypothetical protein